MLAAFQERFAALQASPAAPESPDAVTLRHHRWQSCSLQWRAFIDTLFAELESGVEPAAAQAFYRSVGLRFAEGMALPPCESLEDLERAIGDCWAALDWGWVRLVDEGQFLRISHGAYPVPHAGPPHPGDTAPALMSPPWMSYMLEGVYTRWMGELGGTGLLAVCRNRQVPITQPLVFDFGRHG
ncbi:cellulose biosynthesis protein BcsD [Nitrospirillum pindoramense]|uniref:Cellulose synthase subunit D n=1 Tax=Nitrospirillum amazonense TaxID=28077 RepID=A0A560GPX7_9PROT|nr:cellulose biosynthesis protein BcsD [Nitrospirillum amazonense]TWB35719.1 cellulose synthase subunit D [Nitrospirillum amazonense]